MLGKSSRNYADWSVEQERVHGEWKDFEWAPYWRDAGS